MVGAFAGVDGEVEVERAARAEVDGGAAGLQARAVGGDERVGFEELLVLLAEFLQAGRAHFLAGLEEDLEVETQFAARAQHRRDRGAAAEVGEEGAAVEVFLGGGDCCTAGHGIGTLTEKVNDIGARALRKRSSITGGFNMKLQTLVLAALVALAGPALAQTPKDTVKSDKAAVKQDKEQIKADRKAGNKDAVKADKEKLKADKAKLKADRKAAKEAKKEAKTDKKEAFGE